MLIVTLFLNFSFVGMLIGVPINEFNENKDLEVMTFRRNILQVQYYIILNIGFAENQTPKTTSWG